MTRRTLGLGVALALAALLGSCARTGIFQLTVQLVTPVSAERPFAIIEIADTTGNPGRFDGAFATQGVVSIDLRGAEPLSHTFDVVAGSEATTVSVRVRYCRTPDCSHDDDVRGLLTTEPGFRFAFQQAIWVGRQTSYLLRVPNADAESTEGGGNPSMNGERGWICRCAVVCTTAGGTGDYVCVGMRGDPCDEAAIHPCEL